MNNPMTNTEKQTESGSSILSRTTFGFFSPNQYKKCLAEILKSSPFPENREYSNYLLESLDSNLK